MNLRSDKGALTVLVDLVVDLNLCLVLNGVTWNAELCMSA
jgi:hypothetical protein